MVETRWISCKKLWVYNWLFRGHGFNIVHMFTQYYPHVHSFWLSQFCFLGPPSFDDWPVSLRMYAITVIISHHDLSFLRSSDTFSFQNLKELPALKNGEMEIPKRWHVQNKGQHLLDILRDWRCPPGIQLLMGLLKYNPEHRWTAEKSLAADFFSTLVSCILMYSTKSNLLRCLALTSFFTLSLRQLHWVWCLPFQQSIISTISRWSELLLFSEITEAPYQPCSRWWSRSWYWSSSFHLKAKVRSHVQRSYFCRSYLIPVIGTQQLDFPDNYPSLLSMRSGNLSNNNLYLQIYRKSPFVCKIKTMWCCIVFAY